MDLKLLCPIHHLVQKLQEERIKGIPRRTAGHGVQTDRQADDVAAQAPDMHQVLSGESGELNLPGPG